MSKSALESTWLYHEIGRCHLELEHFDESQEFGKKSLEAAREAEDDVWQLNANVLVAQSLGIHHSWSLRIFHSNNVLSLRLQTHHHHRDTFEIHSKHFASFPVKLKNYSTALEAFESSLDMAKKQKDTLAESAIRKAMEEVHQKRSEKDESSDDEQESDRGEDSEVILVF